MAMTSAVPFVVMTGRSTEFGGADVECSLYFIFSLYKTEVARSVL